MPPASPSPNPAPTSPTAPRKSLISKTFGTAKNLGNSAKQKVSNALGWLGNKIDKLVGYNDGPIQKEAETTNPDDGSILKLPFRMAWNFQKALLKPFTHGSWSIIKPNIEASASLAKAPWRIIESIGSLNPITIIKTFVKESIKLPLVYAPNIITKELRATKNALTSIPRGIRFTTNNAIHKNTYLFNDAITNKIPVIGRNIANIGNKIADTLNGTSNKLDDLSQTITLSTPINNLSDRMTTYAE